MRARRQAAKTYNVGGWIGAHPSVGQQTLPPLTVQNDRVRRRFV
jgi:hypothetical protein